MADNNVAVDTAKKTGTKYGTLKIRCNCQNTFQDQMYGFGIRVHNRCKSKSAAAAARCTSCENVKEVGGK